MARRAKGRGTAHDKQREKLKRKHIDGSPCWWCGRPMYLDKGKNFDGLTLAADHSTAIKHGGKLADRLLHFSCNSSRKAGERDSDRPASKNAKPAFRW